MTHAIVNIADVELQPRPAALAATGAAAERYDARIGRMGALVGAKQLGYNVTAIAPGKAAFPAHNHRVNEEMFFVLQGTGEIRIGAQAHALRPGDVVACPAGGPETAHQIVNTGAEELRFLAVSTLRSPEVCEYPNSGKFGVYAEFAGTDGAKPQLFRYVGRETQNVGYWDGE
jgi:uncharacterized cupin superfamily protein